MIDETGRNIIETVIESVLTEDWKSSIDKLMKRHRHSRAYLYIAMNSETQEMVFKSKINKYWL